MRILPFFQPVASFNQPKTGGNHMTNPTLYLLNTWYDAPDQGNNYCPGNREKTWRPSFS
jgi:hypothetical protein